MQHNSPRSNKEVLSPAILRYRLKLIGSLSRKAMEAGNNNDLDLAFLNITKALALSQELDKKCLEAKLLNNLGILYTMQGTWDTALLKYDQALDMVARHYGTDNVLYRTLQKNILYLFRPV